MGEPNHGAGGTPTHNRRSRTKANRANLPPVMSWDHLEREIAAWAATGREATFWWRDDDAVAATPALDRLLGLTGRSGIPLALAVIPARAEQSLQDRLADERHVTVVQHGYAHRNHAAEGVRAVECGGARSLEEVARELTDGRQRLERLFGDRFLPVLVPPWNRIDAALPPRLPGLGFTGLSTWGAREGPMACVGLAQVHTHADPVAWRRGRVFGGAERVTQAMADHLQARREGRADRDEPTGLLTHHLVHDAPGWDFLKEAASRLASRPGLRWVAAAEAFGATA
jgi:peptidoglycan/xylan/chitin deacetylase (PgdA/CDA1 family)